MMIPDPPQQKQDPTPYLIRDLFNIANMLYANRDLPKQEIANRLLLIEEKCAQIRKTITPGENV